MRLMTYVGFSAMSQAGVKKLLYNLGVGGVRAKFYGQRAFRDVEPAFAG
jgi:hypothetical protein